MSEPPQPPDANAPDGSGGAQQPPPGGWEPPVGPVEGPPHARPTPGHGRYQPPQYQPGPYDPQPYQQPQYSQGGYPPAGYPQGGYPQGGYPQGAGHPSAPTASMADRLGSRVLRRPLPRFGTSLAGAAAALVLIGLLIWSLGYLTEGLNLDFSDNGDLSTGGTGRRFLGALLFLVLAGVGYTVVVLRRRGPLATAGIVSGAVAVPLVLIFLTFDIGNIVRGELPFNLDAVYIVSIIVWLGSYFLVPGARGRSFLLGSAAAALSAYVALKAGSDSFGRTAFSTVSGDGFDTGGTDSLAAVGLIFGVSYYVIAAFLDKQGRHGAAVAMAYAAFGTTVAGVIAAAPSFDQVGTGILLIVLGIALTWYGGRFGRRFTSWAWAVGFVIGIGLLVAKAAPDSYTAAGIMFVIIGAAVAAIAHVVASTTSEEPDIVEDAQAPARVT
jgi:hypothetical protein